MRIFKKILFSFLIIFILITIIGFIYVRNNTYSAIYENESWKSNAEINKDYILFSANNPQANIVFYPGGFVEFDAYGMLGYLLSLEGFNVYIMKMPLNLAILGISKFEVVYTAYPSDLPWYIGGHSLGGASASIYVKDHDSVIDGIFFLGAYPANSSDLSQSEIKVLSITASLDNILNQENFENTKSLLPSHTIYEMIVGGNHSYFGFYGMQKNDGVATITNEQQHVLVVSIIKNWILS
jgi:hypothetical protein